MADYDGRDEEDNQDITWSRTGTDSADFTIDSSTGVLSFAQRPNYEIPADAGTDNVYNLTVAATDTTSNTRELAVTVTVADVNERPDITEDFDPPQTYMEIEYDFTGTRPDVHTFAAVDYDDMDTFAWSLPAACDRRRRRRFRDWLRLGSSDVQPVGLSKRRPVARL